MQGMQVAAEPLSAPPYATECGMTLDGKVRLMYVLFLCYITMAFSSFSREADKMSISPSRIHPFQCCRGLIGQGEQLQFSVLIFLTIQLKNKNKLF